MKYFLGLLVTLNIYLVGFTLQKEMGENNSRLVKLTLPLENKLSPLNENFRSFQEKIKGK